jgi:hypothetical protein
MMKQLALLSMLAVAAAAHSQTLYSTNFDNLAAGTNGATMSSQGWQYDGSSSSFTVVKNGQTNAGGVTALSGTQMLRATTTTLNSSNNWGWRDLGGAWDSRTLGHNTLHTSVSFFVPADNSRTSTYGLQAYTPDLDLLASITFRPNYNGTHAVIALGNTGVGIPVASFKGVWSSFDLFINADTATAYGIANIGGQFFNLGSKAVDPSKVSLGISEVDFFAGNSGVTQTGTTAAANSVYFDNFKVEAVPEPSTIAALSLGALAFLRRRKSK